MSLKKIFHVVGGGTVNYVRSHMAISAPAYGGTARQIDTQLKEMGANTQLHLTKMACAGQSKLETNDDIAQLVDELLADPETAAIVFNPAITDFNGKIGDVESGKYAERLRSRESVGAHIEISMADKIVPRIKERRPDVKLVSFKTTTHVDEDTQYQRGLEQLKGAKSDFVLANDTGTRLNMVLNKTGDILVQTHRRELALQVLSDALYESVYKKAPMVKPAKPSRKP